ncbi:ribose-phosphate diphosphokinase [Roseovarius salis]|uniref:ribose-phosphate diphosphokinase n=1 Tax=Roseovarius salis TaxID=3376063 RepID=UPI0037CA1811
MTLKLFALSGGRGGIAEGVAAELGWPLAALEERDFEDGEHKARPLEEVRGDDVYVIAGLHGDAGQSPNDRLCRLLFFIGALRTGGAARVTAVIPYLAYARKDRQTKPRDPLTARYVAQLVEAVGTDRVVALEVHNLAAFQNAFRCEALALDLRGVLLDRAAGLAGEGAVCVASPDPGGVKRAQLFREALETRLDREVGFAVLEKRRSAGVVTGELMAGEVQGARVLVIDDMIASGGTMVRAADALRGAGARDVWALAAHGLFTGNAPEALKSDALAGWIVTDSVPPFRLERAGAAARLEIVSAAPLFARAILRLRDEGDVTDLPAAGS